MGGKEGRGEDGDWWEDPIAAPPAGTRDPTVLGTIVRFFLANVQPITNHQALLLRVASTFLQQDPVQCSGDTRLGSELGAPIPWDGVDPQVRT